MYWHIDTEGLKTIHRTVTEERVGSGKGWLRMTLDLD